VRVFFNRCAEIIRIYRFAVQIIGHIIWTKERTRMFQSKRKGSGYPGPKFCKKHCRKIRNQSPGFSGAAAPGKKLPEGGMYGRRLFPYRMQDWP